MLALVGSWAVGLKIVTSPWAAPQSALAAQVSASRPGLRHARASAQPRVAAIPPARR
jgi:hypothetical protein